MRAVKFLLLLCFLSASASADFPCWRELARRRGPSTLFFEGNTVPVPWGVHPQDFEAWISDFRQSLGPELDALIISGERTHFTYGYLPQAKSPLLVQVIKYPQTDEDEHRRSLKIVERVNREFSFASRLPVESGCEIDEDLKDLLRRSADFRLPPEVERGFFLRAENEMRKGWLRPFVCPTERELVRRDRLLCDAPGRYNKESVIILFPPGSDDEMLYALRARGYAHTFLVDPDRL